MAAVSIVKLLNLRILLCSFLLVVSIFLSFLWVIINQIRVSIKFGEWGEEEETQIDVMETETGEEDEGDRYVGTQLDFIELK